MTGTRRPPPNLLVITLDRRRGLGLVRGAQAHDIIDRVTLKPPKWSPRGHGWTVPITTALDVVAYGEHQRMIVRVVEVET